jgi:hypothetical protein
VDGLSILRRPWRVSDGLADSLPNFRWFEEKIGIVAKMPRNKTKAVRNAIGAGVTAAENAESQMRGAKLPQLPASVKPWSDGMSAYAAQFDLLEMSDAYVNLLNRGAHDDQ